MPLNVVGKAHEARATPDFTWFVYGSSLDCAAFAEWAESHGYAVPDFTRARPARLPGYRLSFDVNSRHWGGAVASLAEAAGQAVEGLAVPMPGAARGLVDHKEGAISGLYEPLEVTLTGADGKPVPALAYRAAAGRRLAADAPASPGYLDVLISGAKACGLSAEWVARLEKLRG
ncbi:MAG: gamma-glutamylcyclotransferase family protein [Anaeromyxobacter sp.]